MDNDRIETTSSEWTSDLSIWKVSKEMEILIGQTVKDKISEEISVDKASLFTVFGIFASIVTFVSVEIQILKVICDFWNIAGFSMIVLSSLLMFILLLDYIGRGWRDDSKVKFPWEIWILAIIFLFIGFASAFKGDEEQCRDNSIYQKYQEDFYEKQIKIKKIFEDKIENLEQKIEKNKIEIEKIKGMKK